MPLPPRITGLVRITAVIVLPDITGSPSSSTLPLNVTVVVASNVQPTSSRDRDGVPTAKDDAGLHCAWAYRDRARWCRYYRERIGTDDAHEPVAPPVTVTSQAPPAAASVTVMLATTVVALLAVALFTVTPLQPNATARLLAPLTSMSASVIVTSPVNPASTDAGLTLAQLGSCVLIANPPVHTTVSAPVVTVTSQVASTASAAIVMLALISVALLAVALFTVMPVQLKATTEVGPKVERSALITTSRVVSLTPNVGSTLTQLGPTPLQTVTAEVRVVGAVSLLALSLATISST